MKRTLLLFSFLTLMGWTYAQNLDPSVITSDGGIHATGNISLEWTLGEMAVEVLYTENNMITEGYHQPVLSVSEYREATMSEINNYQINIFPNPVSSILEVQINSSEDLKVYVKLYNMLGVQQLPSLTKNSNDSFELDLSDLPSAIYTLSFTNSKGQKMRTYKISKSRL